MILVVATLTALLIWYLLDLRRQLNEVEQALQVLHKDFAEEMYKKYLERFKDGEE
tara:strand:- start:273 stop:437 length:165 start_codon:yes stop_codon:yes gene_type:complete